MSQITPKTLFTWFVNDFYKITLIGLIFGVSSVYYALNIPNQYSAKVVVASNIESNKAMGGALSKFGGLASLAGVNLGGGNASSPEVLFETISSNSFLAEFIRQYKLGPIVMASTGYNPNKNEFIYDEKLYNFNQKKWVRDFKYPQTIEPNDLELVEKFKDSFSSSYARKTKLISLGYKSFSPEHSKVVVETLVAHFNQYVRNKDIKDSEKNISYLEQELSTARYKEVKIALQQIMEEQYKKLALAKTRDEYAFKVIEAPLLAAKKSEPKRAIICAAITFIGTLITVLIWWSIRIFRTTS